MNFDVWGYSIYIKIFYPQDLVKLWGFWWWAHLVKRKDLHRVISGRTSIWLYSNTGSSSTHYEHPIMWNLKFCTAYWAHFMCHHGLWTTPARHPFSSLNSSLGLAENHYPYHWTMDTLTTWVSFLSIFVFLKLIITCVLWVIYVREDHYSNI